MKHLEPLSREEVTKAVERKNPRRIPLCRAKWWGEGLQDQYGEELKQFDWLEDDVIQVFMPNPVDPQRMGLSWTWEQHKGHDATVVLDDWTKLDEFIERLPDPDADPELEKVVEGVHRARATGRYVHVGWWGLFFERFWLLRGMENLLCDYYVEQENLGKLYKAVSDLYCRYLRTICRDCTPDGFWTSDDLGHQTGPMMSPDIFHEQVFPHYCAVGSVLKECDMHFWLHSCGDNSLLMEDLIAAGLDVFHPVQKHTMDEKATMEQFGGRITFLAGIDVQHTLQEMDPDGVRAEVRFLIDTFDRTDGGLCLGAGNGIVSGTPTENIAAFLEEAVACGTAGRRPHRA